jgi:hypothetical protein
VEGVFFFGQKAIQLSILSCPGAQQFYRIDSVHPAEHSATNVVLRDVVDLVSMYFIVPVQSAPYLVRILAKTP